MYKTMTCDFTRKPEHMIRDKNTDMFNSSSLMRATKTGSQSFKHFTKQNKLEKTIMKFEADYKVVHVDKCKTKGRFFDAVACNSAHQFKKDQDVLRKANPQFDCY